MQEYTQSGGVRLVQYFKRRKGYTASPKRRRLMLPDEVFRAIDRQLGYAFFMLFILLFSG